MPSGSLEGSQESLLEEEIGGQSKMMEKCHIYGTCKQSHKDSLGVALCLLMYSYTYVKVYAVIDECKPN